MRRYAISAVAALAIIVPLIPSGAPAEPNAAGVVTALEGAVTVTR